MPPERLNPSHGWNFSEKKLLGENGSLAGCSAMISYKNKNLDVELFQM